MINKIGKRGDNNIHQLFSEYQYNIQFGTDNYIYLDYVDMTKDTFTDEEMNIIIELKNPNKEIVLLSRHYDMYTLIGVISNHLNLLVTAIKVDTQGCVTSFQNPITMSIYVIADHFDERKETFAYIRSLYQIDCIGYTNTLNPISINYDNFQNQSWTEMGIELLSNHLGYDFNKDFQSNLTEELYDIFNSCPVTEINYSNIDKHEFANYNKDLLTKIDICKCYTNSYLMAMFDFSIYSEIAYPQPITIISIDDLLAGEYMINCSFHIAGQQRFPGAYPSDLILYLLKSNIIKFENIEYYIQPQTTIDHQIFSTFVDYLYNNNFLDDAKKGIMNSLTGYIGKRYTKSNQVVIIENEWLADSISNYYYDNPLPNEYIKVVPIGDLFFVRKIVNKPLYTNMLPIHRQILSLSWIQLDKLMKTFHNPTESIIMSCRTDSFLLYGKIMNDDYAFVTDKYDFHNIGRYQLEPDTKLHIGNLKSDGELLYVQKIKETEYNEIVELMKQDDNDIYENNFDPTQFRKILNEMDNYIIDGGAGIGKSYVLSKQITSKIDNKKIYVIAAMKSTLDVIRTVLLKDGIEEDYLTNLYTIDSFLGTMRTDEDYGNISKRIQCADEIHIDEYSVCGYHHYELLYRIIKKTGSKVKLYLYGDNNQTKLPANRQFDYRKLRLTRLLCGFNRVHLTQKSKRCDEFSTSILSEFLSTQKLPEFFKSKIISEQQSPELEIECPMRTRMNICYLNKTIEKINTDISFGRTNKYELNDYVICDLTHYSSIQRETYTMFNNQLMKFKGYSENMVLLTNIHNENPIQITLVDFNQYWILASGITCFKVQGHTFNFPYTIYDLDAMYAGKYLFNFEMLYTALSRCTNINNVYLRSYTNRIFEKYQDINPTFEIQLKPMEIKKYYLYGILSNDEWVYFGQTTNITERFNSHTCSISDKSNKELYHFLSKNPHQFVVLGEYNLNNSHIMLSIEESYIKKYIATYPNSRKLLNVQHNRFISKQSKIEIRTLILPKSGPKQFRIRYKNPPELIIEINKEYAGNDIIMLDKTRFSFKSNKLTTEQRTEKIRQTIKELCDKHGDIFDIITAELKIILQESVPHIQEEEVIEEKEQLPDIIPIQIQDRKNIVEHKNNFTSEYKNKPCNHTLPKPKQTKEQYDYCLENNLICHCGIASIKKKCININNQNYGNTYYECANIFKLKCNFKSGDYNFRSNEIKKSVLAELKIKIKLIQPDIQTEFIIPEIIHQKKETFPSKSKKRKEIYDYRLKCNTTNDLITENKPVVIEAIIIPEIKKQKVTYDTPKQDQLQYLDEEWD